METFKKVVHSNILEDIFDLPDNLRNKKVVITISSYDEKKK